MQVAYLHKGSGSAIVGDVVHQLGDPPAVDTSHSGALQVNLSPVILCHAPVAAPCACASYIVCMPLDKLSELVLPYGPTVRDTHCIGASL